MRELEVIERNVCLVCLLLCTKYLSWFPAKERRVLFFLVVKTSLAFARLARGASSVVSVGSKPPAVYCRVRPEKTTNKTCQAAC